MMIRLDIIRSRRDVRANDVCFLPFAIMTVSAIIPPGHLAHSANSSYPARIVRGHNYIDSCFPYECGNQVCFLFACYVFFFHIVADELVYAVRQ